VGISRKTCFFQIGTRCYFAARLNGCSPAQAPPFFRFSEPAESQKALATAGFSEITIRELVLNWQPTSGQALLDTIYKSTVRTAMLLEAQEEADREKIHSELIAAVEASENPINLPWPAVIAVATKPL